MAIRRRLFRVSLRALLIAVTVTCIWVGRLSIDARRQKEAVDWVLQHRGQVFYDWQYPSSGRENTEPPRPSWLPAWIGDDYLFSVTLVSVNRPDELSWLEDLPGLVTLSITDYELGEADLHLVLRSRNLRDLALTGCGIDDEELSDIASGLDLKRLSLDWNEITDVTPIRRMTGLEWLDLPGNRIVDVSALTGLSKLHWLDLSDNRISDCRPLHQLQQLSVLDVKLNPLEESEIKALAKGLRNTNMTWSSIR